MNYLIQGIGLLGTVLYFVSFQCRENRRLFQVQLLSYAFYTVHLLLLGAITGCISYLINLARSICLGSKWKFGHSWTMCFILCAAQLTAMVLTWSGWISVLPVAANIAATVVGYTHSARKIRVAGMFINSPLWIVYDLLVGSWAGVLDELASEVSMVISIIRYGWNGLDNRRH